MQNIPSCFGHFGSHRNLQSIKFEIKAAESSQVSSHSFTEMRVNVTSLDSGYTDCCKCFPIHQSLTVLSATAV